MKPVRSMVLLSVVLLLAGCNTPGARIKQKQAVFDSFPPEVQENLRNGRVDIGYTREMVDIALGNPSRIYTRKTAAVAVTVLAYTSFETQRDRQRVRADMRYRDNSGSYHTVRDWVWVDVEHRNEYDRLRVEMTGDVVTAIETAER